MHLAVSSSCGMFGWVYFLDSECWGLLVGLEPVENTVHLKFEFAVVNIGCFLLYLPCDLFSVNKC
jgi:hypothetical protein